MRVLLMYPPTQNDVIRDIVGVTPILGLAYLASVAREKGHEVKIVDALAENLQFSAIKNVIKAYDPDFLGLTGPTSIINNAFKVADIAKSINPDMKVGIGGPHVTFTPNLTLTENKSIDYVIRGEGEIIFANLLDAMAGKISIKDVRGISYRNDGKIINNFPEHLIKNLDDLPFPALDLLPMDRYVIDKRKFATIMTSRGCPYNCTFCSSSLQFGKVWRGHSVERVMKELRIIVDRYGARDIEFLDDTFTLNMKRAIELTNRIKQERLDIKWTASARVNLFNAKIAKAMKEAGAHTIFFGIESASQKTLNFIGKGIDLEQSIKAVKTATYAGLKTLGAFIIGFPEDTPKDVKKTIRFAKKLKVTGAQFTIATPYPGTRLWDYVIEHNLLLSRDWRKFTTLDPVIKLKHFTAESITKWLLWAYLNFYLRPLYLLKDLAVNHGFVFNRLLTYYNIFTKKNVQ